MTGYASVLREAHTRGYYGNYYRQVMRHVYVQDHPMSY